MGAGRKKKPTKLKVLEGTYRPDRDGNEAEGLQALTEFPPAPDHLGTRAKAEWDRVTQQVANMEYVSTIDLPLLAAYCNEVQVYFECMEQIKKNGLIISNEHGKEISNPYHTISNKSLKNIISLASEFGFTPASRAKIKAPIKKQKERNSFDSF